MSNFLRQFTNRGTGRQEPSSPPQSVRPNPLLARLVGGTTGIEPDIPNMDIPQDFISEYLDSEFYGTRIAPHRMTSFLVPANINTSAEDTVMHRYLREHHTPPPLEPIRTNRAIEGITADFRNGLTRTLDTVNDGTTAAVNPLSVNTNILRGTTGAVSSQNVLNSSIRLEGNGSVYESKIHHSHFETPITKTELIEFIKEKLCLKVALSQYGVGLEIKVSLNLMDTDEELISDTDLISLD